MQKEINVLFLLFSQKHNFNPPSKLRLSREIASEKDCAAVKDRHVYRRALLLKQKHQISWIPELPNDETLGDHDQHVPVLVVEQGPKTSGVYKRWSSFI